MNTSRIAIAMGVFGLGALALLPTLRSGDSQARDDGSEDRRPVATPRGDLVDLSWAADPEDPLERAPTTANDDRGGKAAGDEERRVHPDDPNIIEIIPKNQPWTWEDSEKFRQRMEGARDEYAAYAAYPPWSRPYDDSQKHLVEWDETSGHEQSVAETEEGEQIYAHAKLSSLYAGPGEPLYAVVEVWKGTASSRQPVEVVVEGEVRVQASGDDAPDKPNSKLLATVPFHPAPGGFQYTASFVPSQLEPLVESGAREADLVAWVIAGGNRTPFDLTFHFVTTPSFEVLDIARDAVVEGSLDVTLVSVVHHALPVHVTAVLFHQETEQPIAVYDDYVHPTQVGRQEVTVRFFGKAIRDAGKDGPYFVGALHGRVEEAGQRLFWREDRRFATKRYKSTDFSGEEWNSVEKDEKIIQYDRAVEESYP